ncbi:MAG: RbsD/FucU domain-containing protein [Pseudomonadota bacterium]
MLKGIDPLLNAEVLGVLRAMGHGDMLILSDANFPSEAVAAETVHGAPLRIDRDVPEVARAVVSVLPLDTFVDDFAARMEVVGDPGAVPEVQAQVQAIIAETGEARDMVPVERFAFYDLAKDAYAVIQTSERRFYGCIMLRKGVIGPDE